VRVPALEAFCQRLSTQRKGFQTKKKITMNNSHDSGSSSGVNNVPMLRILCLHDANSSAFELKQSMALLGERLFLKHTIDCVYIDSPLPNQWYNSNNHKEEEEHFQGLDASLLLLRQIWRSCGFWGVIGVGQGAAMASLLLALLSNDEERKETNSFFGCHPSPVVPPQFAIFVSAQSILETDEPVLPYELPVLHLVDEEDASAMECRLISQFPGTVEFRHKSDIFHTSDLNKLGRFICAQRKFLMNNADSTSLVALRCVLEVAEQEVSDLLHQSIAEKPPAALLAVIRRNNAGVWQGPKRRDDVGGAPCPSEFLQKREQRQNGGGSRIHPANNRLDDENDPPA
jgi:hypothetical protein